jgi:hypothetical protein
MTQKELLQHAGRTTLFCAIAELSVNDLYYGLAQQRQGTKRALKQHYNLCLREAERLKKVVSEIPEQVGYKATELESEEYSEVVIDDIYKDVAYFYSVIKLIEQKCGDSELRRASVLKKIESMYKDK